MSAEFDWLSTDPDETVVWTGRPRVWRIAGTAAGAVVVSLLAVIGAFLGTGRLGPQLLPPGVPAAAVWGVAALVVLWGVAAVGVAYLRVTHTDYVLTDRSVSVKSGILSETVTSVGVDRVQNTTLRKDITGNRFDYGTVAISTAGSGGADLAVSDLDDPETFRDRLQEQVRAADARRDRDGEGASTGALDAETADALLAEARALRETAERLEEVA